MQQWKDQASPVVDRFRPQIEAVTGYAKDDPAKDAMGYDGSKKAWLQWGKEKGLIQ